MLRVFWRFYSLRTINVMKILTEKRVKVYGFWVRTFLEIINHSESCLFV